MNAVQVISALILATQVIYMQMPFAECLALIEDYKAKTGVMEVVNGEVSTQVTVLGLSVRSNREGDYL
jgi:hypothetical protein